MMGRVMAWTFPSGKVHKLVTSVTLVDATAKTIDVTVPAGKLWRLSSIRVVNSDDVTRYIDGFIYNEAAKTNLLDHLFRNQTLTTGFLQIPNAVRAVVGTVGGYSMGENFPKILEAGNTISILWASGGASTGATDADGLIIEYEEVAVSG